MIWIILAAAIGYAIFLLGGAAVGAAVGVLINLAMAPFIPTHISAVDHPLKNIQDGSQTHGAFFLGSGTVNSEPGFYYYEQTKPNTYRLKSVAADDSQIVEFDGKPHVEIDTAQSNCSIWLSLGSADTGTQTYIFYVPRGSVVSNYKLGVDSTSK